MRDGEAGQYPIGEKMKNRDKASLSCFMMGGFEIVDYSDSINQLHRKLLTKILLNKWKNSINDILTNFVILLFKLKRVLKVHEYFCI